MWWVVRSARVEPICRSWPIVPPALSRGPGSVGNVVIEHVPVDDVHKAAGLSPLDLVGEHFGEDLRSHQVGLRVPYCQVWLLEVFVKPAHIDSLSAIKVPHGGIAAGFAYPDHGLIVFIANQDFEVWEKRFPKS